jgi:hypothetical protein
MEAAPRRNDGKRNSRRLGPAAERVSEGLFGAPLKASPIVSPRCGAKLGRQGVWS